MGTDNLLVKANNQPLDDEKVKKVENYTTNK